MIVLQQSLGAFINCFMLSGFFGSSNCSSRPDGIIFPAVKTEKHNDERNLKLLIGAFFIKKIYKQHSETNESWSTKPKPYNML